MSGGAHTGRRRDAGVYLSRSAGVAQERHVIMSSTAQTLLELRKDERKCKRIRRGLMVRVLLQRFEHPDVVPARVFPFDGSLTLVAWMAILHMVVHESLVRFRYQLRVLEEINYEVLKLARLDRDGRNTVGFLFAQMHELMLLSPVLMVGTGMEHMTREEVIQLKRRLLGDTGRKLMHALGLEP